MIAWCNANSGFMSALLSFVSVVLSLVAIWFSFRVGNNQVKATVFDKKLGLFSAINRIYQRCILLSQIKVDASFNQKLCHSGYVLFLRKEKEYDSLMLRADIARRIQDEEDDDEKERLYKQDSEIGDQEVDFIISVDEKTDRLKVILPLLYPSLQSDVLAKLLTAYSNYILCIFSDQDEAVSNCITDLRKAVESVKRDDVMEKMRKETQINDRLS